MDKFEYKIRADEIKKLISYGDYAKAAEIADTIDWRRVKSVMMLCTISDLYKINRRYEDARDMLLLAYDRRPGGRTICYSLCELSIKMEDFTQAIAYYNEFVQAAPKDSGRYILQYKLYEAQDTSLEERIHVLKEFKKRDYREKWAYELAYLYHRMGLPAQCVDECDELIAWFGDGKYVIKAMELKSLHQPLSPQQQQKYDNRFGEMSSSEKQQITYQEQNVSYQNQDVYTEDFMYQNASYYEEDTIYQNLEEQDTKDVLRYSSQEENEYYEREEDANFTSCQDTASSQQDMYEYLQRDVSWSSYSGTEGNIRELKPSFSNENILSQSSPMQSRFEKEEEIGIRVKTVDVGQYNTTNLQAELAGNLQQVLEKENPLEHRYQNQELDFETESLDNLQIEEIDEEDLEPVVENTEVFFGETKNIGEEVQQAVRQLLQETEDTPKKEIENSVQKAAENINSLQILSYEKKQNNKKLFEKREDLSNNEPPEQFAKVLTQESDGQLSLVMPEAEYIEKQITGQMNIEDILAEWEHLKRQKEQENLSNTFSAEKIQSAYSQPKLHKEEEMLPDPSEQMFEDSQSAYSQPKLYKEEETLPDLSEQMFEDPQSAYSPSEEYEEQEDVEEEHFVSSGKKQTEVPDNAEKAADWLAALVDNVEMEINQENQDISQSTLATMSKNRIRALTKEEKKLYEPFIHTRATQAQLVKVIDSISMTAYTGNIIITGEESMNTLSLAKNMMRELQITNPNFSGKVAKISGQALNRRDVLETIEQLKNGALIIQKASCMTADTAKVLYGSLQQDRLGIIIILEDTKKAMNHFLEQNPFLNKAFTGRMDVEAMSNDALVEYGKQYAKEKEYTIGELGVLALHTRITELQTADHVVTIPEVRQMVDEAIESANKKSLGHFFDILFAKRYDEEDMIILNEDDFII